MQGDIVAIYNSAGTKIATYTYSDAWGNHTVSYTNGGGSTGAQITGAVMATGLTMIVAAATDSQMVMDISGSMAVFGTPAGDYFKVGETLLIDFNADEAYLYPHVGAGGGQSWGITGDISYATGLVWNYDSPDDFERSFIDIYVGGVVGLEYGVSPNDFFGAPTQSLCITFSGIRMNSGSMGAGVDYYFPPVKIFDWRGVK